VTAVILVLAGVNGAGKSSLGGAFIRQAGMSYFNPDEAAAKIRSELACSTDEANALAWQEGRRRLETAIRERTSHAFETTLGGKTIPRLLAEVPASQCSRRFGGGISPVAVVAPAPAGLEATPEWAKPIVASALQLQGDRQ
jgi:hypothetical protein